MSELLTTGQDAFGPFTIERNQGEEELCIACGRVMPIQLEYIGNLTPLPGLPEGIDVKATILTGWDSAIGIHCGCYAKFHRQVAHIQDRMKSRSS